MVGQLTNRIWGAQFPGAPDLEGKVVAAFFLSGLLSGSLSSWLVTHGPSLASRLPVLGLVFATTLALAFAMVRARGLVVLRRPKSRYVAGTFMVLEAWPAGFAGFIGGMILSGRLLRGVKLDSVLVTLFPGMLLGALLSAVVIGVALRVFTGCWEKSAFLWLVGSNLCAVLLTVVVFLLAERFAGSVFHTHRTELFFGVLLPTGMSLSAASCGLWLHRASNRLRTAV